MEFNSDPDAVVTEFLVREERTLVINVLSDLTILLAYKLDEDQLAEVVNNDLECYYYPPGTRRTYRQWLLLIFYQINLYLKIKKQIQQII